MNKPRKPSSTTRTPSRRKNVTTLNTQNGVSHQTISEKPFLEETDQRESASAEVNALGQYLSEIGQHPLLTIEQEQALAQRMKAGDTEAFQCFIEANLRSRNSWRIVAICKESYVPSSEKSASRTALVSKKLLN